MFNMGGNQIGAKTLDLNKDFRLIAAQLDAIAEQFFGVKRG
jgi:5-methylcytosine-specific restriction enzyme subunit McrC